MTRRYKFKCSSPTIDQLCDLGRFTQCLWVSISLPAKGHKNDFGRRGSRESNGNVNSDLNTEKHCENVHAGSVISDLVLMRAEEAAPPQTSSLLEALERTACYVVLCSMFNAPPSMLALKFF